MKALIAFWALVTATYTATIVQRSTATATWPGLATVAGGCAILAVWLELLERAVGGRVTAWVAAFFLFATLATNTVAAALDFRSGRGSPLGRIALTLLFAVLCGRKIVALREKHG